MKRRVMKFCSEDYIEMYPVDDVFAGSGVLQLEEVGASHRLSFGCPGMGTTDGGGVQVVSKVILSTTDLATLATAITTYLAAMRDDAPATLRTADLERQVLN